jgi:multidrug efflux pump subunit AcrA (membrane-fusion protein)
MFHSRGHCVRTDDGFHALVYLSAAHAVAVHAGQPAQVSPRGLPDLVLPGRVLTVAPPRGPDAAAAAVVPTSRPAGEKYLVTIALTATDPRLRHGMAVDALITTHTVDDVLTVPNSAVIRVGDVCYVEVLEPTGERHRVSFTPGLIGYDTTEVRAGLSRGQTVILTPSPGGPADGTEAPPA